MVRTPTKLEEHERSPDKDKPWHNYRGERDWKDLEPGFAGALDDEQLARIQEALRADDALSYWWGFKPGKKRRQEEAIRRVSMHGDPDNRSHNATLARQPNRRARASSEGGAARVTNESEASPPRIGRKRIESWESEMLKLDRQGWGVKRIAENLRAKGVSISHMTVARRLAEIKGS